MCEVYNDNSDAPATALNLESTGLGINETVHFKASDVPAFNKIILFTNLSLLEVNPNNYSMMVYAVNNLGKVLVHNETVYLRKSHDLSHDRHMIILYRSEY